MSTLIMKLEEATDALEANESALNLELRGGWSHSQGEKGARRDTCA